MQELVTGSACEESPQPREIDVQDRVDSPRRSIAPELLDESLARNGRVRMHEEKREERAQFRTTEREYSLAPDDLERPEDAKLEIRTLLRRSDGRASLCEWERPRLRLLDVFVPFSRRFVGGLRVVACAFSGASIPWAG